MKRFFVLVMSFFSIAGCGGGGSPPRAPGPSIVYAALGDSVSASPNINSNVVKPWPFLLATRTNATSAQDLAVNGATIETVLAQEIPQISPGATLVTLMIGANDFARMAPSTDMSGFLSKYHQALVNIHARVPTARIVLVNEVNITFLPCCSGRQFAALGPTFIAGNRAIDSFYPQYTVVDIACNPGSYNPSFYPQSDVHPNQAGHDQLASFVYSYLLGNGSAPQTTCPPYM